MMEKKKVVIIDDEANIRELNRHLLLDNFTDVDVVGEADCVDDAVKVIELTQPDIVLLDIEIKGGTGFHVLQRLRPYSFKLIFITAFNQFAIKAIKFSALDYILKPVNEFEFVEAISNALKRIDEANDEAQVDNFIAHYGKDEQRKKMVLRTSDSMHIIEINDIMYCKSDNSYTTFYIKDQKEIVVSKGIKEYAELLEEYRFIRPHQSYLVSLDYIQRIDKSDGGFIILNNGKEIPVSSRRKQSLLQLLDQL
ncbi:LytR/AlgR family response regulator transcription factor [Carboxylicivirga sp. N1Y90]|uniref:LytR/AlgR family response regulator transcription factor n=1 Tax=Carboxylicivirga fragile TaxID=3417571 RepID=UPI003D348AB4|nr:response regulator transcription factor [Marinilabiliaceae bacterium N1Y90]